MNRQKNKISRCGFALIAVLWLVVLLGVIASTIGRNSRGDSKVTYAQTQSAKVRWACRAGIDTAVAVLNEDSQASDGLEEAWAYNEEDFNNVQLEGCSFTVKVTDEASKLNLNRAGTEELMSLEGMTEEIADAIKDWRDKNDEPRASGVEGGYYENLEYGYKIRNGRFRTIRELLSVKGVSRELLFGEDTRWIDYLTCYSVDADKDAAGNKRIDINSADENKLEKDLKIKKSYAKWIVENKPKGTGSGRRNSGGYKSIADLINKDSSKKAKDKNSGKSDSARQLDLETFYKIADKITVGSRNRATGKVNVNTAPAEVLAAVLGGGEVGRQLADSIVEHRQTMPEAMDSVADILEAGLVTTDKFKKIAAKITVRSDVYSIVSLARADDWPEGGGMRVEAVIERGSNPPAVLYWYQAKGN